MNLPTRCGGQRLWRQPDALPDFDQLRSVKPEAVLVLAEGRACLPAGMVKLDALAPREREVVRYPPAPATPRSGLHLEVVGIPNLLLKQLETLSVRRLSSRHSPCGPLTLDPPPLAWERARSRRGLGRPAELARCRVDKQGVG